MPVKLRAAKERRPAFPAEALTLFVELERKRAQAFTDDTREPARMLGLVSEWWTGNHVNDRSAEPSRPPSYVAHHDWHRCREVRKALLEVVKGAVGGRAA